MTRLMKNPYHSSESSMERTGSSARDEPDWHPHAKKRVAAARLAAAW
jgi:hypothetical protein